MDVLGNSKFVQSLTKKHYTLFKIVRIIGIDILRTKIVSNNRGFYALQVHLLMLLPI